MADMKTLKLTVVKTAQSCTDMWWGAELRIGDPNQAFLFSWHVQSRSGLWRKTQVKSDQFHFGSCCGALTRVESN
jgi:hypothetical protein